MVNIADPICISWHPGALGKRDRNPRQLRILREYIFILHQKIERIVVCKNHWHAAELGKGQRDIFFVAVYMDKVELAAVGKRKGFRYQFALHLAGHGYKSER